MWKVELFRCAGQGLVLAVFDDGDLGVCGMVGTDDLLDAFADGFFAVGVCWGERLRLRRTSSPFEYGKYIPKERARGFLSPGGRQHTESR